MKKPAQHLIAEVPRRQPRVCVSIVRGLSGTSIHLYENLIAQPNTQFARKHLPWGEMLATS
jgi:hypothetical protein